VNEITEGSRLKAYIILPVEPWVVLLEQGRIYPFTLFVDLEEHVGGEVVISVEDDQEG
jgi:hypothetical protein